MSGNTRVVLVGLDGATFALLRPWVEEGHLPMLARMMREGAWGPLASTIPPSTPPAWTSMVTGVYPGRHGIFGFVKPRPGSYDLDVVTSADRRHPALWTWLSAAGLRSLVVDVPFTYPPDPLCGVMVAGGMGTPDVACPFVSPPSLKEAILRECGPYPLDIYPRGDPLALLDDARRLVEHRVRLARFLDRVAPWDFMMLVLVAPDRVQHVVWHYLDPRHPRYRADEATRLQPAILDFYRSVDDAVATLVDLAGPQARVLIVSDHGFGPLERRVSLARWLADQGLIEVGGLRWEFAPPAVTPRFRSHTPRWWRRGRGRVSPRSRGVHVRVDRPDSFAGVVFELNHLDPTRRYTVVADVSDATPGVMLEFDDLRRRGNPILGGDAVRSNAGQVSAVFQPTEPQAALFVGMTTYRGNPTGGLTLRRVAVLEREDWSRSRVFLLDTGQALEGRRLQLNLRGREPFGTVQPGEEADRLCAEITGRLLGFRDDTGRPLVARVYRAHELYAGPYAAEAADLTVLFADGTSGTDAGSTHEGLVGAERSGSTLASALTGSHRPDGILVAMGAGVVPGPLPGARIVDVCPTVLAWLGVPVPDGLDGRVLTELTGNVDRSPGAAALVTQPPDRHAVASYTDDERRAVEAHLRRLGYME